MTLKVLHVITGLSTGGAETMLFKLLTRMKSTDSQAVVISLTDAGSYGARIEEMGVPVHELGMSPGRPSLKALTALRRLIKSIRPDVIQGWMYHANIACTLANTFNKNSVPVVWNIRQSLDHYPTEKNSTRKVIKLGAYLSGMANKIIYNSRYSAVQHGDLGYRKSRELIIPNGFDCDIYKPSQEYASTLRRQLGIAEDAVLIGMVGRFHPMKDHDNFLHAATLALNQSQQIAFLLVGSGLDAENKELMGLIDQYNLADRVILLGERTDIPAITASLDIATLTSSSEAFPNVVGEAMACGVPCVVTRVGDAQWIIDNTGIVVPAKDPEALSNAWLQMVSAGAEERNRLGQIARQRIIDNFSISQVATQYRELYTSLVEKV